MARGYRERVEYDMHRLAWHAANVMNVHLKKKVTVKKLLGQDRNMSREEKERHFNRLIRSRKG
ncbi:hypothetical protein [Paludifilum halophilum]|nr:hypothetical protein [Paludifilum halophilum]